MAQQAQTFASKIAYIWNDKSLNNQAVLDTIQKAFPGEVGSWSDIGKKCRTKDAETLLTVKRPGGLKNTDLPSGSETAAPVAVAKAEEAPTATATPVTETTQTQVPTPPTATTPAVTPAVDNSMPTIVAPAAPATTERHLENVTIEINGSSQAVSGTIAQVCNYIITKARENGWGKLAIKSGRSNVNFNDLQSNRTYTVTRQLEAGK